MQKPINELISGKKCMSSEKIVERFLNSFFIQFQLSSMLRMLPIKKKRVLLFRLVLLLWLVSNSLCFTDFKRIAQTTMLEVPNSWLDTKTEVLLCTMIGKEAPHLAEWVAYNRLIGVSRFVLFELSTDEATRSVLKSLSYSHDLISVNETTWLTQDQLKLIHLANWTNNGDYHAIAAQICQTLATRLAWWVLVIDPDEFIVMNNPQNFGKWLTGLRTTDNVGAVILQRNTHGTNGHKIRPQKLLTLEAYPKMMYEDEAWAKLVTYVPAVVIRHNHFVRFGDPKYKCITVDGRSVDACEHPETKITRSPDSSFFIAHMISRSWQECVEKNGKSGVSNWRRASVGDLTRVFAEVFCIRFIQSAPKKNTPRLITEQLARRVREEMAANHEHQIERRTKLL